MYLETLLLCFQGFSIFSRLVRLRTFSIDLEPYKTYLNNTIKKWSLYVSHTDKEETLSPYLIPGLVVRSMQGDCLTATIHKENVDLTHFKQKYLLTHVFT